MGLPSPSFWHHRRVFVTGCTGFLGTWVVRELLAHGADVIGLVRDRPRPSDLFDDRLFQRIAVVRGRVEDRWRLESAFAVHGVQTVFHLAAPAVALTDPADPTYRLASRWTRTVLAAAARAVRSGEVVIPVPASDRTGITQTAGKFARQAGYAAGVAELPRLFGGGDRTWSRLVPRTVRAVLSGRPVYPLREDERAEPYLYARDAARACLWLAESLAGDPEAWAGRACSFDPATTGAELFEVLTAPYLPSPLVGSGVRGQYPAPGVTSPNRWRPAVPLLDAVAETVAWYRRHLAAARPFGPTVLSARIRSAA
jgi:CDP-glucose 4,6-dehydratase